MKLGFSAILTILTTLPALTWSLTIPNADTPVFYLVSSSTSSSNLLPLRLNSAGTGSASLLGSGAPARFYFYQGLLTAYDPIDETHTYRPLVNSFLTSTGCESSGALVFIPSGSGSSNKCARYTSFQIQSNGQNSQLGAQLVFNYVGGFYSCNGGQDVYYKLNATDGPSGCQPIDLWTVPTA